jgi:copper chaperone
MTTTTTLRVSGMTCGHCVSAVTEELTALDGVTDVDVDLNAEGDSRVTVTSSQPLDPAAVATAVADAGYTVTVEG